MSFGRFTKWSVLALMGLMLISLVAGCGSSKTDADAKPTTVTVYAGMQEDHVIAAMKEFEKATGIKVNFVRMSGGEIMARVRAEKGNPQADVWYGGPADTFIAAKNEGMLTAYKSPNAAKIAAQFKDADGYWTGVYVGSLGFASNKEFLAKNTLKAPESWEDLLNPAFKGQIAMADPGASGTSYTMMATIIQLMGEEKGFEYLKKLHANIAQYPKTGSAPGRMAGLGEVGVGIIFSHDTIKYMKEGFPLVLSFPKEGTGYEIGAIGIIKGAPHSKAAQMFVDWALTKEAQEIGQKTGSYQLLTNPDAIAPQESIPLSKLKVINYDFTWAGDNRQKFLEKWNQTVRNAK